MVEWGASQKLLRLGMAATRLPGSNQIALSLMELAGSAAGGADENVTSIHESFSS
jgi:hypothetical protein